MTDPKAIGVEPSHWFRLEGATRLGVGRVYAVRLQLTKGGTVGVAEDADPARAVALARERASARKPLPPAGRRMSTSEAREFVNERHGEALRMLANKEER